jgi:nitrite reductase/ring-hydroxylating ferredoxin subunit
MYRLHRVSRVQLTPLGPAGRGSGTHAPAAGTANELDLTRVLPGSWQLVADLEGLRSPGDYVTAMVGCEPVVVVRSRDGALRGFSNVCTHRACVLLDGAGNCGRTIRCPYHGWSFDTDGRVLAVPYPEGFRGELEPDALALAPVDVEVWAGRLVFVRALGDAPPPEQTFAPVAHLLDLGWLAAAGSPAVEEHLVASPWWLLAADASQAAGAALLVPGEEPALEARTAAVCVFPNLLLSQPEPQALLVTTWEPLDAATTRVRRFGYGGLRIPFEPPATTDELLIGLLTRERDARDAHTAALERARNRLQVQPVDGLGG